MFIFMFMFYIKVNKILNKKILNKKILNKKILNKKINKIFLILNK